MSFNILSITENQEKQVFLEKVFTELGYQISSLSTYSNELILRELLNGNFKLVISYESEPSRLLLKIIRNIQDNFPTPIIIFTDTENTTLAADSITAGASSYVFDGISRHRLPSIIETSIARFDKCQSIKKKLEDTELKLVERRDIEKAKGILMKSKGITEEEAYSQLRKMAMSKNIRMGILAKNVITTADLLED